MILRTKLQMPVLKGKILYRARILSRMLEHRDRKLIAVCADAGYGKTTLLVQFCNELKAPFVYYTLDESDHDPATFFLYLLEGMRTISPRFGDRTQQALRQTNNFQIIAGTFINECLAMVKDDVYLVLDDHHYLGRSSQITRAIDFLLKNSPPVLHFVISSRSAAPVNIPWFQAKQDLLLVDRDALRFSAAEIDAVIALPPLLGRDYRYVIEDLAELVGRSGVPVKVILETCRLTREQKAIACALASAAGAAFVKTSTGFAEGGATAEDVALMRSVVGDHMGVKASGGIRTAADALRMVQAGADRLGTSASVAIVTGRF